MQWHRSFGISVVFFLKIAKQDPPSWYVNAKNILCTTQIGWNMALCFLLVIQQRCHLHRTWSSFFHRTSVGVDLKSLFPQPGTDNFKSCRLEFHSRHFSHMENIQMHRWMLLEASVYCLKCQSFIKRRTTFLLSLVLHVLQKGHCRHLQSWGRST